MFICIFKNNIDMYMLLVLYLLVFVLKYICLYIIYIYKKCYLVIIFINGIYIYIWYKYYNVDVFEFIYIFSRECLYMCVCIGIVFKLLYRFL